MKPIYTRENITLFQGNSLEVLPALSSNLAFSIDAVIMSPPYAEQRKTDYRGVSEQEYPDFALAIFEGIRPLLKDQGSIFMVIRPHISGGQISDYVLRTRLKLRTLWTECEELIWIKSNSAPLGSVARPRRSWESILWFGKTGGVYCDTRASKTPSERIGLETYKFIPGESCINGGQNAPHRGISRDRDFISIGTRQVEKHLSHPAMFPEQLPAWLLRLATHENATIMDPFVGSGTTGIACIKAGRKFVGIEVDSRYCDEAIARFEREFDRRAFQRNSVEKGPDFKSETVRNNTIVGF